MLREAGMLPWGYNLCLMPDLVPEVQRFAVDVVGPKVREMDEKENMDPSIIKSLFEQGVCCSMYDNLTEGELRCIPVDGHRNQPRSWRRWILFHFRNHCH